MARRHGRATAAIAPRVWSENWLALESLSWQASRRKSKLASCGKRYRLRRTILIPRPGNCVAAVDTPTMRRACLPFASPSDRIEIENPGMIRGGITPYGRYKSRRRMAQSEGFGLFQIVGTLRDRLAAGERSSSRRNSGAGFYQTPWRGEVIPGLTLVKEAISASVRGNLQRWICRTALKAQCKQLSI